MTEVLYIVIGAALGVGGTLVWFRRQRIKPTAPTAYQVLVTKKVPRLAKELSNCDEISLEDFGLQMKIFVSKGEVCYRYITRPTDMHHNQLTQHPTALLMVMENEAAILQKAREARDKRDTQRIERQNEINRRASALLD